MDNFNCLTDDFPSKGFYQLYSDPCMLEDFYLWTDSESIQKINEKYSMDSELIENSNDNRTVGYNLSETIYIKEDCCENYWTNNTDSVENLSYFNLDAMNPPNFDQPNQLTNYFESNCDHLSLDDCLFNWDTPFDPISIQLPERTLFCSDSCDEFLKESSEHLKSNLQNLQPADTTEQKFICSYLDCRKVYAKAAHLKAHLRRHIGDKPYHCTWANCTWRFSRSDELARHRRSHSGIKPYKCDYCTKCFSRSDHLSKHRKVHERKMAAQKLRAAAAANVWSKSMHGRPGRRSKKSCTK